MIRSAVETPLFDKPPPFHASTGRGRVVRTWVEMELSLRLHLMADQGTMQPGVTLRDLVHAIPLYAIKQGLLTVEKKGKKNIFNGRILEIEGLRILLKVGHVHKQALGRTTFGDPWWPEGIYHCGQNH